MEIKSAWLTTNRSCNLRCKWCYAQNTLKPRVFMDFEKALKAVKVLRTYGTKKIVLIGGEPTIYDHFFELIECIRKNDINCTVATNGVAFKDLTFAKRTVESGVNNINISIKATTEEEYENSTGISCLKQVMKGYNNLKMIGFNPIVSYVIVNDNKEEFNQLIDLLKANNVNKIGLQFVKPVLELKQNNNIMDVRSMARFVEYIYEKMKESNMEYSVEVSFPLCLIKENILSNLISENKITTCCHIQKGNGIVFDTDFKVLPCNHFAEYPFSEIPIDFSKENSIENLWSSEEVKYFRQKARCYPSLKCRECKNWNICGGGCFTRWLFINPKDYINK